MKNLTNAQILAGLLSVAGSIGPKCTNNLKHAILSAAPLQTDREALIAAVQSAERCANAAVAGKHVDMNLLGAEMRATLWAAGVDASVEPGQADDLLISRAKLMTVARQLIAENLPDTDEEFMAARAHGIGSLHTEILAGQCSPKVDGDS